MKKTLIFSYQLSTRTKLIENFAKEIFPEPKTTFPAAEFRKFYTAFQKPESYIEYRKCVEAVCKHNTSQDTIFKLFTNSMFTIQRDILQGLRDREPKEMPGEAPRISTDKELNM